MAGLDGQGQATYRELVALIGGLEKRVQGSSSAALKFSEFIGEEPPQPQCRKYSDLVDLIDRYETRLNSKGDSKKQQAQVQQPAGNPAAKAGNPADSGSGKTEHKFQDFHVSKIEAEAKTEIELLEKRLHVHQELKVRVGGKQPEKVLINLSAADQVAELEKIITGLKGNAFSKEQLTLIHDEVSSLSDSIAAAAQQAGQGGSMDPLLQLRDSHLAEVQDLLGFS